MLTDASMTILAYLVALICLITLERLVFHGQNRIHQTHEAVLG
jgi:hypothetical protein